MRGGDMQRAVRTRALSAVLQRHVAARRMHMPAVHAQVRIGPRSGDQLLLFVGWGVSARKPAWDLSRTHPPSFWRHRYSSPCCA